MIDTEQMKSSCMEIVRIAWRLSGLETEFITAPVRSSSGNASARQPSSERPGIVVTPLLLALHERLTTELAGTDDQVESSKPRCFKSASKALAPVSRTRPNNHGLERYLHANPS